MQQIASKKMDGVDVNHEEDDGNDEIMEATPSSTEMKLLLHHLQIGLEQKEFEQMDEFEKFSGHVWHFSHHQQLIR